MGRFLKNDRLNMILAMGIFGTIGLFVRNIPLPSEETALYRAVLAILFIGLVLLLTKQRLDLASMKKELPLLLLSGAAMGFNWIFLFEAYQYTTISIATLSYYFAPVLVTVLCPLLFREKMTVKAWICFGMSTLGLVLITGIGDLSAGSDHLKGIGLGLLAAVLYAAVILLNKTIRGVEGLQRTFLQFLAAALVLLPYVAFTGGFHLGELTFSGWGSLLIVGLLHSGVAYCLYFSALKALPGQKAAILSYIDPLTAVLLSVLVLGEPITWVQALGGLLILGFTLWKH